MSSVFSKNKEKRPRTSSNEANTSFVKNVTSRVSGLLPSTITKWFSSPSSSNANGSAPTADATDSSTEDEASETPVITQPPAKRMRFNTPGKYNHFGPADANHCSTSSMEITEIPYTPFGGTQFSQSSRNNFITPVRPLNEEHSKERTEKETAHIFKTQHTVASIGQSIANKRKSIFQTSSEEETAKACAKSSSNTVRDPKQPSFKPSLLGSPFYPGRTMYGGAASSYINQPNIKQQTVAVVNESKSNDDTAISSSARRIMDLLESYSSPLMEARRIPQYTRPKNNSFNTSADRFSPYTNKSLSYKTQELHVPSIASILRLKKKSRLMDTTNAARQIIASHSSASNYPVYTSSPTGKEPEKEQPNKMTTKVKSRLTRTNRGNQDETDVTTPVKLPTAVLQIDQDKLPKFSFGTPPVSNMQAPATSTPKVIFPTADKKVSQVLTTSKHETVTSSVFTFSNPVKVSNDTQIDTSPPKYTFDSPERRIDQKFESKSDNSSVVVGIVKENEKLTSKLKDWQCSDCWVQNKPDAKKCVCCGSKQPSQNAKCTVCKLADSQSQNDKCVNCEKMQEFTVPPSPLVTKSPGVSESSKWKCEDCWVSNEGSAAKCACCGGKRPNKPGGTSVNATVTSNADTVSKKSEIVTTKAGVDWKCDDCWISNKSSVEKCAACGGAKPGSKQTNTATASTATTTFFGSTDTTFKNIAQSQKSAKWECSSCLVQNDKDKDKCACCGAEKENKNKMTDSKFNFGTAANSSFKFGIDPKVQEASISKKPELQSTLVSKVKGQSETNNNVLAETPTFTFALPAKKIENKIDVPKTKSGEVPKMNFTFGIPKQLSTSTTATYKSESAKELEEEKEKPQEVPSVDLNSMVPDKPKPLGKIFESPLTQINNEKPSSSATVKTSLNTITADVKKDGPTVQTTLTSNTNKATENTRPAFTFGVKSNANVFDSPTTTATSVNLFTQPSQSTTPSTSAPTLSLFKSPENSTVSTSLFQKPDSAAKPVSLFQNSEATSTANTAPMFSFGNTGTSNATSAPAPTLPSAPEKPKFQFTFGSNSTPKTDQPVMFKSPFGGSDSNVNNTNSFALPAGSSLGSTNVLPTNSLGGSNGLTATNGLTGNTLTGSALLSGNPLTGNSGNTLTGNNLAGGNGSIITNNLGGTNGLPSNPLSGGNGLQPGNTLTGGATGLFGNPVQKENVWSTNNSAPSANLFVSNTATSSLQKPPTFTFGSSTPFNTANTTPTFGSNAAPQQNIFGMGQTNNTQPSLFSNAVQSQPTGNLFGSPPASNPAPQMGLFGTPNIGATPTFGTPNPSIPSFETPSLTPAPAPAFNFGAPQSTGIFGFGQQQPLQQPVAPQQTGVYSFGGAPAGAPQVQFTMGSGANTAVRRVRKAVRRNPQR